MASKAFVALLFLGLTFLSSIIALSASWMHVTTQVLLNGEGMSFSIGLWDINNGGTHLQATQAFAVLACLASAGTILSAVSSTHFDNAQGWSLATLLSVVVVGFATAAFAIFSSGIRGSVFDKYENMTYSAGFDFMIVTAVLALVSTVLCRLADNASDMEAEDQDGSFGAGAPVGEPIVTSEDAVKIA